MKRLVIKLPELLYCLAFLLYLAGSSLTHIENGAELSLWLMVFGVVISMATTTLPWLGIRWLRLSKKGWQSLTRAAIFLQVASWLCFGWAMFLRLGRNLPPFHTLIMITTLLWATWLLTFFISRYACKPR